MAVKWATREIVKGQGELEPFTVLTFYHDNSKEKAERVADKMTKAGMVVDVVRILTPEDKEK